MGLIQKDSRGFTLIEILIGAAIMTTGFMALSTMMNAQIRGQRYIMQKYEATELMGQIKARVQQPNFCKCNMPGTHNFTTPLLERILPRLLSPRTPTSTDCTDADDLVPAGGEVPSGSGLKVSAIRVRNFIPSTPTTGKVDISIEFAHEREQTPIRPMLLADIPVVTSGTPAALQIESCGSVGGATAPVNEEAVCRMLGFTYDPTQTPPCTILGSIAARGICQAVRGTPVTMIDGTPGCRVTISFPGATQPGGVPCVVPMASNLKETTLKIASWIDHKIFAQYPRFHERIAKALSAFTEDATDSERVSAIYSLAGVNGRNRQEVVAFLRTETFIASPFTDRLVSETGMRREDAALFLTQIAGGMRGNLN